MVNVNGRSMVSDIHLKADLSHPSDAVSEGEPVEDRVSGLMQRSPSSIGESRGRRMSVRETILDEQRKSKSNTITPDKRDKNAGVAGLITPSKANTASPTSLTEVPGAGQPSKTYLSPTIAGMQSEHEKLLAEQLACEKSNYERLMVQVCVGILMPCCVEWCCSNDCTQLTGVILGLIVYTVIIWNRLLVYNFIM